MMFLLLKKQIIFKKGGVSYEKKIIDSFGSINGNVFIISIYCMGSTGVAVQRKVDKLKK
jgi:hypothetical protein